MKLLRNMGSFQSRKKSPEAKVKSVIVDKVSSPLESHSSHSVAQNHKNKPNSIFPLETSTLSAQELVRNSPKATNFPNNSSPMDTNSNPVNQTNDDKAFIREDIGSVISPVEISKVDISGSIVSKPVLISGSIPINSTNELQSSYPVDIISNSAQNIKSSTNSLNSSIMLPQSNTKDITSDLQIQDIDNLPSTTLPMEGIKSTQELSSTSKGETIHSLSISKLSYNVNNQDTNISRSTESNEINFLPFSAFSKHGSIPRYPDEKSLVVSMDKINFEDSLMVFISHCWLRGWNGASGWDGVPHPDNARHEKYQLIVEVIQKVWSTMAPSMKNCYLWLDYGCINQDADPAGELKQLDTIVKYCDCIITPLVDDHYRDWRLQLTQNGYYVDYKAPSWNQGNYAYLNRGWCRIEMFFAANIPVAMSPSRLEKFSTGLHSALSVGRRAHLLYGTRESMGHYGPIVLQPLVHSNFETYNPIDGSLTFESDRDKIRHLVNQLEPYIHRVEFGYIGNYNTSGERHGLGSYYHENGDIYDGMFINNLRQGHGKLRYATGAIYEGEFVNDIIDNYGKFTYPNGDVYTGENKKGNKHGSGQYIYANGDTYSGEYKNDMKDGYGRFAHTSGSTYEGLYHRNNRHGTGKLVLKDGSIYEGQWSFDKMDGKGIMQYSNGNKYSGDWCNNERHGKGKMTCRISSEYDGDWWHDKMTGKGTLRYPTGDLYEGDFLNGLFQGIGKLTFANSLSYYEGHFQGGMKEGQGCYRYANGDIYTGNFKADKLNGSGVFKYANGNLYEGEYVDNKKNGNGKFTAVDGHTCQGQWCNDLLHGKGKYIYANGDIYEGDFLNGKFHGIGKYTYKSGTIFEGCYENDQRHGAGKISFVNGNMSEVTYEKGVKLKKIV